jgi:hypothetical protein
VTTPLLNLASPIQGTRNFTTSLSKNLSGIMDSPPAVVSVDLGGRDKPIINFRPHLWRHLEQDREVLNLDLFWPMKLEDIETSSEEEENSADRKGKGKGKANDMDGGRDPKGVFPFKELAPLKTFQNLHYLQLNGMMRSYQPLIWAACWVNKKLTTVRLEMALEPVICEDIKHKYRTIDDKWSYVVRLSDNQVHSEYLGAHGDGTLHEEFGEGEYLDQHAVSPSSLAYLYGSLLHYPKFKVSRSLYRTPLPERRD